MGSTARTVVTEEVTTTFNEIKLGKQGIKWVVYNIVPKHATGKDEEFRVEKEFATVPGMSDRDAWKELCAHLVDAKSPGLKGGQVSGPRFAVFDFHYKLKDGEGQRKKIALIDYCPDTITTWWKMAHSASSSALRTTLNVNDVVIIKDDDELEYNSALQEIDSKAELVDE